MSRRLKVLISAYACEPNKGSEPEVGWQWAMQMARFHDVTVLTRANNRPAIEKELASLPAAQPRPAFVYHDRSAAQLQFKREFRAVKLYYLLWQRSARDVIARLNQKDRFDLIHHVTFAGFRYPTAIWGHGVPTVWGPIGGIESIPLPLLPWFHPKSLFLEICRDANNVLQAAPFYILPKRARATTTVLASTAEMRQTFARLGASARVMPAIGLNTAAIPHRPHDRPEGPLKLLFVGNIITLKGVDFALKALQAAQTSATFTLIGSGNYLNAAKRLTRRLGLEDRVFFRGRLPRGELLKLYSEFDVFLFPSLHDTGGYAVIEAMCQELPVICLNCGGPALAVPEDCGIKVNLGSRSKLVSQLASAIQSYDRDRERLRADGRRARENILRNYDWDKKGSRMNEVYQATAEKSPAADKRYSGVGSLPVLLHTMFSFKGAMITLLGLLLIGASGFFSLHRLKREADQIVNDTLPGLSTAGAANASLAEAFNRTVLLLLAKTPAEKAALREQLYDFSRQTTSSWQAYEKQIFSEQEKQDLQTLLQDRQKYLEVREQLLQLVSEDRQGEAMRLCSESLLPAYTRYKEQGEKLLEYNMKQSRDRGKTIMRVCNLTQIFVGLVGMLLFVAGFLFGLFR